MALRIFENSPQVGKLLVIGLIAIGLMIPLSMLRGLIAERQQMRDQAVASVAGGWGGELTAGGPILRVPFTTETKTPAGEVLRENHDLFILPNRLNIESQLEQQPSRHVGIYEVPVYIVRMKLTGSFRIADTLAAAGAINAGDKAVSGAGIAWNQARLRLPMSDVRSVRELSAASAAGRAMSFGPGTPRGFPGIESRIDLSQFTPEAEFPFSIEIRVAGSHAISFLPTAATTQVHLDAEWRDPQFQGAFLPAAYRLGAPGFVADWQVLALNRSFSQSWADDQVDGARLRSAAFGVELYQSVDVYQRSERAVKYALLFIALTFLSFFGWEVGGKVRMHPVQYLFIGLALSTFYLLLIALAEHLAFGLSYWLGAAALVLLLGVYVAGALESTRRGALLAAVMSGVYALLYLLVLSESYSLLLGAIALFLVLAAVMLATRRQRWEGAP